MPRLVPLIVQQPDAGAVIDTDTTTIPASASSALEIVASLNQTTDGVLAFNETSAYIGVYEDDTLKCVIPPGWSDYLGCVFQQGASVKLRNMANVAISADGKISCQFFCE